MVCKSKIPKKEFAMNMLENMRVRFSDQNVIQIDEDLKNSSSPYDTSLPLFLCNTNHKEIYSKIYLTCLFLYHMIKSKNLCYSHAREIIYLKLAKIALWELSEYFLEIFGIGIDFDKVEELYRAILLKTEIKMDGFFRVCNNF